MKVCKYAQCSVKSRSLSFCEKHYRRYSKYGDASTINKRGCPPSPMPYSEHNNYYEIQLSNCNRTTRVSKEDFFITKYRWHLDGDGYACSKINGRLLRLHKLLVKQVKNLVSDHINRDRLDNRRENLRLVSKRMNSLNRKGTANTSGHVGVRWHKSAKKYIANIRINGRLIHLGYFDKFEDAVKKRIENTPKEYLIY